VEAGAPRRVVAEFDEFGPRLDARHARADSERVVEVVVDGERQVALARPHVNGGNLFATRERRRLVEAGDRFHEAVYLPELVAHRRANRAALVRHAERPQVDVPFGLNGAALAPVVPRGRRLLEARRAGACRRSRRRCSPPRPRRTAPRARRPCAYSKTTRGRAPPPTGVGSRARYSPPCRAASSILLRRLKGRMSVQTSSM